MSSKRNDVVIPESSVRANWKCMVFTCIVAVANMQYGFDTAIVGGFQAMPGFLKVFGFPDKTARIGYGIDPTFQQLISSLMTLGSFVSSLTAGVFGWYFGRKPALWLGCAVNLVGLIVQIATTNKGVIYLGRFLLGLSNGFLVTFSNIYISEVSPAHLRGVMLVFFTFWVNFGSLMGSIVNYFASKILTKTCYIMPLGTLFIVPVFLAIAIIFVPESPRWLLYANKQEEGKRALQVLRVESTDQEYIDIEWAEMVRGMEEEKHLARSSDWKDMYRGTNLRRTILCYAAMASHAASGIWFAIAYGTYFMQIAGVTQPFLYTIMNLCIGIFSTLVGMYVIRDMFGRRFLFWGSSVGCGLSMTIIGIGGVVKTAQNSKDVGKALIAGVAIFTFFYNVGIGTVSYPVGTEVVSTRLRTWTVGTAISLGYVLAWFVSFFTPYFINPKKLNWGVKYGWIWAGSNFICAIFFYIFLPETKGRTLEELDELFENRVSVKDFPKYCTKIGAEAVHDVQVTMGRVPGEKEPVVNHVEKSDEAS
ncbi:general substrate transporter [Tricladium varicosporioides]|nr:general substrate transporter [Hymenoscyphus varicosporioides]